MIMFEIWCEINKYVECMNTECQYQNLRQQW